MNTFRFAHPLALLLLIFPAIVAIMIYRNHPYFQPVLMRYSYTRLTDGLPLTWRVRLRRLPDILRLLAWILLVFALARPQSGRSQEILRGEGIDIVLALDISTSMGQTDFAPQNRLEAAKSVITDFVNGREFDRIGLVVFAQNAFQHIPPTLDYTILLSSLNEVELANDLGLEDGTAIGLGIASAANMLRNSTAMSKIIILLTDGANNAGALDPMTAAEAVATLGIKVYTIGVGSADSEDSDLDEATLQNIADTTDAFYFRAQDLPDLQAVYNQIDVLERSIIERQIFVRWREQGGPLLAISLALLILERLLRHTVFQVVQ
ncbi:MAG: VWA domain-containing protein [Chloroflexi bacterium]|nr:MAG: aerotolerance regulator BatA [Phototrophicales bacterium]RMF77794.1 MAG: VWA domain-containing protein [Chloroflexota bacterium]